MLGTPFSMKISLNLPAHTGQDMFVFILLDIYMINKYFVQLNQEVRYIDIFAIDNNK